MSHTAITLIAPLRATTSSVRAELALLGEDLDAFIAAPAGARRPLDNERLDAAARELRQLLGTARIAFLSFFVMGSDETGEAVLEVNFDGSRGECYQHLAAAPTFLRSVFPDCTTRLERYLREHDRGANAYYVGCPGRSVQQVIEEEKLKIAARKAIQHSRQVPSAANTLTTNEAATASAAWQALQASLRDPQTHAMPGSAVKRPFWVRFGLHPQGLSQRVRALTPLLPLLLLVAALYGLLQLGSLLRDWLANPAEIAAWQRQWLELDRRILPWLLSALLIVAALAAGIGLWWRELPVHVRTPVRLAAILGVVARTLMTIAVFAGLIYWLKSLPWQDLLRGAGYLVSGSMALALAALAVVLVYLVHGAWALVFVPLAIAGAAAIFHRHGWGWVLAWSVVLALIGIFSVARLLLRIRRAELHEQYVPPVLELAHWDAVTCRENRYRQNHLVTLSDLKPGMVRLLALRAVLRVVNLAARIYFNLGHLASITSIHFARFLILEDPRGEHHRLLFIGNYTGSFGAYLGAFSAVVGVTAVWSNTMHFPTAAYISRLGAADEERFKLFGRAAQVPTLGWYSAYPDLAVAEIDAATATHEALRCRVVTRESTGWIETLRRRLGRPIDEAGCEAALRRL